MLQLIFSMPAHAAMTPLSVQSLQVGGVVVSVSGGRVVLVAGLWGGSPCLGDEETPLVGLADITQRLPYCLVCGHAPHNDQFIYSRRVSLGV